HSRSSPVLRGCRAGLRRAQRRLLAWSKVSPYPQRAPSPSASAPDSEMLLRLVGHHFRRPWRLVGQCDIDKFDPGHAPGTVSRAFLEIVRRWTSFGRGRHHDVRNAAIRDANEIDQAEVDDVVSELGIDHEPKRFTHLFGKRV